MQLSRIIRVFAVGKQSGSFHTKLLAWSLLVCAMPGLAVQAGQTDYRLVAGDVIEISAANTPDLRQRVPVRVRVGLLVCEDAWYEAPARLAREAGAELLAVINASPFHVGKGYEREQTMRERVRA